MEKPVTTFPLGSLMIRLTPIQVVARLLLLLTLAICPNAQWMGVQDGPNCCCATSSLGGLPPTCCQTQVSSNSEGCGCHSVNLRCQLTQCGCGCGSVAPLGLIATLPVKEDSLSNPVDKAPCLDFVMFTAGQHLSWQGGLANGGQLFSLAASATSLQQCSRLCRWLL